MAHRSRRDLLLDDQGILLDDDEPVRSRGSRQHEVTFDDSHPFADEPTLNLSEFEDSIKEEIDYGEGHGSEDDFGKLGLDDGAEFDPAVFQRLRTGSQTQDSLAEFEAIEEKLVGSHPSALLDRSGDDSEERTRDRSNRLENSAADQYEEYLSEQEHDGSGYEFSLGGEKAEQHSPGLDDFAAKYGSQSAKSCDVRYANEEEDVSKLIGEESFPRNTFLDSSLLNDTVIPINESDTTREETPQPTFDLSKNSTQSPSKHSPTDHQTSGDQLSVPSKTPLTSTPNSPTDGKRPDISVQSVRDDDSESRTPLGRPNSDLSFSSFNERVTELANRDAAILRPRFTVYGAKTKVSPPKAQSTSHADSEKKASNVSFKIDRASGRILGVSQSSPPSDPSKTSSLRDRRRRNRMTRVDSGPKSRTDTRSRQITETESSVSDLDLDASGRANLSRSELSQRLKDEVKSKTETSDQLRQLQEEYDNLLAKYALAEVTIDHMRLGAKVNLYSDLPKPAPVSVGSVPQPQKIQMVDIPRSQRAQLDTTVQHRSQAVTASLVPPQHSHSRLTQTGMAVGNSAAGPDPFLTEGEEDPALTATASGESLKVALLLQAASLEDQVDSFEALLDLNQLNLGEQDEVLTRLQSEYDHLNQDYLDTRDEHDRRRRAGDTQGEFDEDKSVAGKLHQLGMRLEDLGERVQNNRTQPSPDTTQQDTDTSLRDSTVTTKPTDSIHTDMDLPLGEELQDKRRRMEAEFHDLMDRYSQLKEMPRTPARDREIQDLMQQLQELREDAPLSLDVPPELDDSVSQVSSLHLEETDIPEDDVSRLPSRLLGHTQPDTTSLDQSSLHFPPDSPDRNDNQWQAEGDQVSEHDNPQIVRPKERRNSSQRRTSQSQNKDDVPLPDSRLSESRRSSTMFQPCAQSSLLPKPILKPHTQGRQLGQTSVPGRDRCDRCGQPLQSQPSAQVGSTSSVVDSGRSSPMHRPVTKATQDQPQQEAEIDSGFIGSESSRQSQMTTPLVPKREPRTTQERRRSPVTSQASQKPPRPSSGHRTAPKHRATPLQQVSDSDSPEERPTTVREVQRPSGKKTPARQQDVPSIQRRRPPSTRSRGSTLSHKRHHSSSEDMSRTSAASSRGSSRDEAIQGLKTEVQRMRDELDDRLRRSQNRDRPGKSGHPSTPREPIRAYPMDESISDENERKKAPRSDGLKGPYTGKDYTPYASRSHPVVNETRPLDTRDLRLSRSRTRTPSPVGSERQSTRHTHDRSTSPVDTRPNERGRSDYTPRRTGSYVQTTGPCPLCGGSGVHTHGEYVHAPPPEYRYVPVTPTQPVSPVVHYVPVSPRYVPTTPRTLHYDEVVPSPEVVYHPSPVVYVSPRRGRVRYYQRKYSVTETEEDDNDMDDTLRLSHLHLGSSLERAERAAREMKRRSYKMANTLDRSLSRSRAKLSAIDWY